MLKNCSKTALIPLKVCTGGTVTNSNSESVNSLLRRAGLNTQYPMLTVLRYLDNFMHQHNNQMKHRFTPSHELLSVLSDDIIENVTTGALSHFKGRVQGVKRVL